MICDIEIISNLIYNIFSPWELILNKMVNRSLLCCIITNKYYDIIYGGRQLSNEDMILQVLKELKSGQEGFSQRLDKIDASQEDFSQKLDKMNVSLAELSDRVTNVELHLENVTDKNIRLLAEQYKDTHEELKDDTDKINKLLFDVDNLKRVAISHSHDINMLMNKK